MSPMVKEKTLIPIQNLSDDVLAALVARDKVRKMNGSPVTRPHDFVMFFNELSKVRTGKSDKETAKLERQKKEEIHAYIKKEDWGMLSPETGELVGVFVD